MKIQTILISLLFLTSLSIGVMLTSCSKNNAGNFHAIIFNGTGNAYINSAAKNNIVKKSGTVITSIDNGILSVSGSGDIYVDVKDIDTLIANGEVNVSGTNMLTLKNLFIEGNGNSNLTMAVTASSVSASVNGAKSFDISGNAADLSVNENGLGTFSGFDFVSKNCSITLQGIHDCEVNVTGVLNVTLIGTGNVYYMGNPTTVNSNITGIGKLFKK